MASKKRSARNLPFLVKNKPASQPRPLATVTVGDKERLVWERFIGPAQAALTQVQNGFANAQFLVVEYMMKLAKLDPADGWKFNVDKMRFEKYPVTKDDK